MLNVESQNHYKKHTFTFNNIMVDGLDQMATINRIVRNMIFAGTQFIYQINFKYEVLLVA